MMSSSSSSISSSSSSSSSSWSTSHTKNSNNDGYPSTTDENKWDDTAITATRMATEKFAAVPPPPNIIENRNYRNDQGDFLDTTNEPQSNDDDNICPICYEEFSYPKHSFGKMSSFHASHQGNDKLDDEEDYDARTVMPISLHVCGHTFCQHCLLEHCRLCVNERKIPIPCPAATTGTYNSRSRHPRRHFNKHRLHRANQKTKTNKKGREENDVRGCDNVMSDEQIHDLLCLSVDASRTEKTKQQIMTKGQQNNNGTTAAAAAADDDDLAGVNPSKHDFLNKPHESCSKDYRRYHKFKMLQINPTWIACTQCENVLPPPPPSPTSTSALTVPLSQSNLHKGKKHTPNPSVVYGSVSTSYDDIPRDGNFSLVGDATVSEDGIILTATKTTTTTTKDKHQTIVRCESCNHSFCSIHGDLHPPDMTCDDFETITSKEQTSISPSVAIEINNNNNDNNDELRSDKTTKQGIKPCSHCSAPIYLEGGCDHIVCANCKRDFCFACGTHVYLSGKGMYRTCSGCNRTYFDHRYERIMRVKLCLFLPLWLPVALVWVVYAVIAFVVTFGFCCCFWGGTSLYRNGNRGDNGGNTASKNVVPLSRKSVRRGVQFGVSLIFMPFIEIAFYCGLPMPDWYDQLAREMDETNDNGDDIDDDDGTMSELKGASWNRNEERMTTNRNSAIFDI